MRGAGIHQDTLFSLVSPEHGVPKDHPLRPVRCAVGEVLKALDIDFDALYVQMDRDLIPSEKPARAQVLMASYTIRSARQLVEQRGQTLAVSLVCRFSMDDTLWHHSTQYGIDACAEQDCQCFSRQPSLQNLMGSLPIPQIKLMAAKSGIFSTAS